MIDEPKADAGHDPDVCGECRFVGHRDFISVSSGQLERTLPSLGAAALMALGLYDSEQLIVSLGKFVLPGWSGHNEFWLFRCSSCGKPCKDYLHGYNLYLRCDGCGTIVRVHSDRFYAAAGLQPQPTAEEEAAHIRQLKRELSR